MEQRIHNAFARQILPGRFGLLSDGPSLKRKTFNISIGFRMRLRFGLISDAVGFGVRSDFGRISDVAELRMQGFRPGFGCGRSSDAAGCRADF